MPIATEVKQLEAKILEVYNDTASIKETSLELNISRTAVKKHLISAGKYTNDTHQKVTACLEAGMSTREIAETLGIAESTVCMYTPYRRQTYLVQSETKNAAAVRRCRKKKMAANHNTDNL